MFSRYPVYHTRFSKIFHPASVLAAPLPLEVIGFAQATRTERGGTEKKLYGLRLSNGYAELLLAVTLALFTSVEQCQTVGAPG